MRAGFIHLHVHSRYSFGRGVSSPAELLDRAAARGMRRLALTDTNGLYGLTFFCKAAHERGMTPICGVEIDDPADPACRAVILAADQSGFAALCRLITQRQLAADFSLVAALRQMAGGVQILTAHPGLLAEVAEGPLRGALWAEITPRTVAGSGRAARHIAAQAARLGLPLVAGGDVHFADPRQRRAHRVLRAASLLTTIRRLPSQEVALPEQHLFGPEEAASIFRDYPQALDGTARLAEVCCFAPELGVWRYPRADLPAGESAYSLLWKLAAAGLVDRYSPVTSEQTERFQREMATIERGGFAPYFLVVHDILRQARQWGMRHVGRGSAANSIVSYCLGITAVDPIRHNLFFERFLNPARTSPPDIDIDFSWKERPRIIDWVYERYGRDRVAMIGTHVTLGPRGAIRETARALGFGPEEIGPITRRIPSWGLDSLAGLREKIPECRELPLDREPWKSILALAEELLGCPRHISIHAGGIIVAPEPLAACCPLQRSASGLVVTQYDMHGVEDVGLIKIDLLSQRSLGVLEETVAALRTAGTEPPVEDFALVTADRETRALVREGRTMGCFYIESPAMRALLRKLRTESFEDLTAASSVIRPGVAESGMMAAYIERHRDPSKTVYLHPLLEEVLAETHGVMIYQEDVIRVAHRVAGLSLAEADLLRRSMSGKMRSHESMAGVRETFVASARERGVADDVARELWRQIESFAGYAFCKAHSASYAVLSLQLAYLKAHHPAHFMAGVLSNGGGFYSAAAYIQECRRLDLRVLLPDVNLSSRNYSAEGDAVRIGLMAVGTLSERGLEALLHARGLDGPYRSIGDLVRRGGILRHEVEALVRCGACDRLGPSRPALLWELAFAAGSRVGEGELLPDGGGPALPHFRDYSLRERLAAELEILGYTVSAHPLDLWRGRLPAGTVTADRLAGLDGRAVRMAGWPIAYKRVRTKKGKLMKFLSLEDLTGTFEAVIFPDVYRRVALLTTETTALMLAGTVREEQGVAVLEVRSIERLAGG